MPVLLSQPAGFLPVMPTGTPAGCGAPAVVAMCPRCYVVNFKDVPLPWILRDRANHAAGWIFMLTRHCLSCEHLQFLGLIDGPGTESVVGLTGRAADVRAAGEAGVTPPGPRRPVLVLTA